MPQRVDILVGTFAKWGRTRSRGQNATNLLNEVDVLIPGELIDWTVTSYAHDAAQLGKNKAILHIGHFNSEELGMKYAAEWINELVDPVLPIQFVRSGDPYQYVL